MSSEQRKVLEDIQRAKRLLKEGAAVSHGIHTSSATAGPLITNTTQVFPASVTTLFKIIYFVINYVENHHQIFPPDNVIYLM